MSSPSPTVAAQAPALDLPTLTAERLHTLDVLRGFALLGMILVHFHMHSQERSGVDELVRTFIWRMVETKSHGTFALLFGVGFALQLRRAEARGAPFTGIYLRRLAVLALFGLAAHVLFGFNVLMSYAVWGVPLLLIRRWSTTALLITAGLSAMSVALYSLVFTLSTMAIDGREALDAAWQAHAAHAAEVNAALDAAVEQSSYSRLIAARWHHLIWFSSQPFSFMPGPTMTLFIAGLLAIRHHLFDRPLAHVTVIVAAMAFGIVSWLVDNWLPPVWSGLGLLRDQWLAFTYVGGAVLLLAWFPRLVTILRPIGQAGRMALTNYLLQIVILDLMFSGYALHMPALRPIYVPLATVLLFGAEVGLSKVWLAHFRFGPAEWAWRSCTYRGAQPLRRQAAAT